METKCDECYITLNEHSRFRICLKCHAFVCFFCQTKHTKNYSGHHFRFPLLRVTTAYNTKCKQHHYKDYDEFCLDCSELVCSTCLTLTHIHKEHTIILIDELANEQKQEVASEIERIVKSNKKVQTQLDKRERNLEQLIKKANDIELDLNEECKRINALISKKKLYLKSSFKDQQNEDLCEFLSKIKSLKIAFRINEELEKTLEKLSEEAKKNKKGFLIGYAEFRKYSEKFVIHPKAVDDEFLSMEIDYQKSTDEEIKNVLPRICIGSTHDVSRGRRRQEENDMRKVDSTRTQTDTRETDKQITDLENELRSTCKVIQVLSDNVIRLTNASSSMDEQCNISLETPRSLPTYLNMDKKIKDIHLSMENIKQNIEKKNILFKMAEDRNRELKESTKRRELKPESTAEGQKVQSLEKRIAELENRLKTSDAQPKKQEELYIIREQSEKSEVEIQKWKKTAVEIQDRYETMCDQHETMKRKLKRSEEEKEIFMTRLSQVAGAKLTAGNSSIADLGDKYRPTRISEMFAEMYDSDWTDVMDSILESHKDLTEEYAVRHIFIVLQECFRACKRIATEQMKRLCEDMFLSASTQDLSHYVETHVTEIKQLQDARKGTAPFVGKMLKERVFGDSTFGQNCRRIKGISMSLVSQITESGFGQQCLNICWFMVVQDPEMHIDGHLQHGIKFDKEVYKEYTKSGKRVAFSVWPALYLNKDGPLLTKGVAQPCD